MQAGEVGFRPRGDLPPAGQNIPCGNHGQTDQECGHGPPVPGDDTPRGFGRTGWFLPAQERIGFSVNDIPCELGISGVSILHQSDLPPGHEKGSAVLHLRGGLSRTPRTGGHFRGIDIPETGPHDPDGVVSHQPADPGKPSDLPGGIAVSERSVHIVPHKTADRGDPCDGAGGIGVGDRPPVVRSRKAACKISLTRNGSSGERSGYDGSIVIQSHEAADPGDPGDAPCGK